MNSQQSSPSVLAGMSPESIPPPQAKGAGSDSEASGETGKLRETIQMLRKTEMDLQSLTERFPAAAPSLRQAATGIRSALRQIIANPGTPEPAAPSIGG
jgi:hypothetical protein